MTPTSTYFDRQTGELKEERFYRRAFLLWTHNSKLGRALTTLVLRHQWFSTLYGALNRSRLSKWRIRPFVKRMDVMMHEAATPIEAFESFNDFFTREIDLSKRPVCSDPGICVAPVDGKVLAYPSIGMNTEFSIKGRRFNLRRFLNDDALAASFDRGSMVISRLCLADYHHFHFPDSGLPQQARPIAGKYHTGGPYAVKYLDPFYTENYRMITMFDSDYFGTMALVEIGAFTVGSIQQRFQSGSRVTKGAHKGFFELGGSTVVLLFQMGTVELDEDLCRNTQFGIETFVKVGDSIGRTRQP
ncbi:MAG TPA: phosphatidylserine decarboxylase [Bacteroidetes bacterium]|nr:phosphatidylserine decarboxylase [Bacteroidota bacterium]